jgi:hypothetical protein
VFKQCLLLLLFHFKQVSVTSNNALTCNVPLTVSINMRYKIVPYVSKKIHYFTKYMEQQVIVFRLQLIDYDKLFLITAYVAYDRTGVTCSHTHSSHIHTLHHSHSCQSFLHL